MKIHHLFISHSWTHSDRYKRLLGLLENRPFFDFKNYSIPKDDPIHDAGSDKELSDAIRQKMRTCDAVLVLAGVDATYSKWISKEMKIAESGFDKSKPVIAVEPWGSERTSAMVKENASRIVGWNADSIIGAIRDLT